MRYVTRSISRVISLAGHASVLMWLGLCLTAGCTPGVSGQSTGTASTPAISSTPGIPVSSGPSVGSERDAHGCVPSAGYRWCARENSCQRPWELAAQKGFAVDRFDAYCSVHSNR